MAEPVQLTNTPSTRITSVQPAGFEQIPMHIVVLLMILWMPFVEAKLLPATHASTSPFANARSAAARPRNPVGAETITDDGPVWSALDDRQMTGLLTNSAPKPGPPPRGPIRMTRSETHTAARLDLEYPLAYSTETRRGSRDWLRSTRSWPQSTKCSWSTNVRPGVTV